MFVVVFMCKDALGWFLSSFVAEIPTYFEILILLGYFVCEKFFCFCF